LNEWDFSSIFTGEGKRVQLRHRNCSLRPKKARMSRSRVKTMIIVFFDSRGIVHKEFVPPGQTVNHAFYKDFLERLRKRVQRVRRDIADDWVLHHDNAPAHTVLSICEFLAKKNIPVLPHPPYSPDLALCDFYLLKLKLKGHHFGTMENIQKNVTDELHTHLRKMTSCTVMISGKNVGNTV
jgi:transposase